MFVAVEFQSIRNNCLAELETLLKNLSIPLPDWSGNEYRIYERLDNDITEKICMYMKSPSIFDGYTKLLKFGDIPCDSSETDSELLAKIISNDVKILDAVREGNVVYDSWWEQWGNISPVPKKDEILRIEAVNTRPFDKTNLVNTLKKASSKLKANLPEDSSSLVFGSIKISSGDSKKISNARAVISTCIHEAYKLNNLLEVDGESHSFNSIDEFVRKIIEPLRASDSCRICLKITKKIVCQTQEIPLAPPKPEFTVEEIEEILKILFQVGEIIKKI